MPVIFNTERKYSVKNVSGPQHPYTGRKLLEESRRIQTWLRSCSSPSQVWSPSRWDHDCGGNKMPIKVARNLNFNVSLSDLLDLSLDFFNYVNIRVTRKDSNIRHLPSAHRAGRSALCTPWRATLFSLCSLCWRLQTPF